jgi:hypothetical protein
VQPHRVEKFRISRDPQFEEQDCAVAGLDLHPPDRALVLSIDEKSQILASYRSARLWPLRAGMPVRQRQDCQQHGTSTPFRAFHIPPEDRALPAPPAGPGVRPVSPGTAKGSATQARDSLPRGQLLRAQEHRRPALLQAQETSSLSLPFHSRRQLTAQPSGALVRVNYRAHDSPRNLSQRCRAGTGPPPMVGQLEQPTSAVPRESYGGRHPRQRAPW